MENKEIMRAEEAEGMGEETKEEKEKKEEEEGEGEMPKNCATCGGCA